MISPESVRPFPKAATRPVGKGRKRVKACILTEDENAIRELRAKQEKKDKAEEKKRKAGEKKGQGAPQKKRKAQRRIVEVEEGESEAEEAPLLLDDSSEYSEEEFEDPLGTAAAYPFQEKEPEVRTLS